MFSWLLFSSKCGGAEFARATLSAARHREQRCPPAFCDLVTGRIDAMAGLPPRAASPPSGDGRPLMLFTPNDGSSYVIVSTEQPRAKEMLVIGERAAATPCYSRAATVL